MHAHTAASCAFIVDMPFLVIPYLFGQQSQGHMSTSRSLLCAAVCGRAAASHSRKQADGSAGLCPGLLAAGACMHACGVYVWMRMQPLRSSAPRVVSLHVDSLGGWCGMVHGGYMPTCRLGVGSEGPVPMIKKSHAIRCDLPRPLHELVYIIRWAG